MATKSNLFRPDLQALRALAVILVLLFHVKIETLAGGYLGVDIFFVLSGYLIIGQIYNALSKDSFSFVDFYARRINRLLPAALMTVLICCALSFFLLPGFRTQQVFLEGVAANHWFSNFLYFFQSGYFDSDANGKMFLHFWSLSVEEQFYLLTPLLLFYFWGRSIALPRVLWFLTIGSLAAFVAGIFLAPSAAFFLFPFRIFQFTCGGLIAVALPSPSNKFTASKYVVGYEWPGRVRKIIPVFLLIFISLSFIQDLAATGFFSILTTLLTAGFIIQRDNISFGSNRVIQYLGQISYSLYLVHWPIIVFFHEFGLLQPWYGKIGAILISIVLGSVLYHGVENRVRYTKVPRIAALKIVLASFSLTILLIIVGLNIFNLRPVNSINQTFLEVPWNERNAYVYAHARTRSRPITDNSKPVVVVFGDSQAGDFINLLVESGLDRRMSVRWIQTTARCGTVNIQNPDIQQVHQATLASEVRNSPSALNTCRKLWDAAKIKFSNQRADVVVIASLWDNWTPEVLEETIKNVRQHTNRLLVVGRKLHDKRGIDIISSSRSPRELNINATAAISRTTQDINQQLDASLNSVQFLDIYSLICPSDGLCDFADEKGRVIYYDNTHFTRAGATYIGTKNIQHIQEALGLQ